MSLAESSPIEEAVEQAAPPPRRDLGVRVQAWLRDRHGLSFGRMESAPSPVLVAGGACRAWRYSRNTWTWWSYVGVCAMTFALLAAGVTARRVDASTYFALTSFAWATVALAAIAWTMALQTRRKHRHLIAVAWDAGQAPLTPEERTAIVAGLRSRWPDAQEHWLVTLRTVGLPENDAGLRVIPVRESDLPRLSAGAGSSSREMRG